MSKITKAIIPVAGYGTRFLPITKAVEKTMLPVINRPVVDYVVEDCITAGIEEIIFIVQKGSYQLESYYSQSVDLEKYLIDRNSPEKLDKIKDVHTGAKFSFIEQPQDGRYGTAIPPLVAKDRIEKDEQFLVIMGDQFMLSEPGESDIKDLVEHAREVKATCAMSVIEVPWDQVSNYGVAKLVEKEGEEWLEDFVENPTREEAPSNLNNLSRFVFDYAFFETLENVGKDERTGEYLITDALLEESKKRSMLIHRSRAQYMDCGRPEGLINANYVVAKRLGLL